MSKFTPKSFVTFSIDLVTFRQKNREIERERWKLLFSAKIVF